MTKEEAISTLRNTAWLGTDKKVGQVEEAVQMAIAALQTDGDCISRHGRDESKLRARLKFCEYCNEDSDGYVKPIEKNSHAFVRFGMDGWELSLKANGWHGSAKIRYCPMCGRRLERG